MWNFLIGLFLEAALTEGVTVSANLKGPRLTCESGRLRYAVVVEGGVQCVYPWVSSRSGCSNAMHRTIEATNWRVGDSPGLNATEPHCSFLKRARRELVLKIQQTRVG